MTRARKSAKGLTKQALDALVEEATVDAYDASEQVSGLFSLIEERLALPFTTQILGVEADVAGIELNEHNGIVAVCRRGRYKQRISLLDLPLPGTPPPGWESIEAYRHWAAG